MQIINRLDFPGGSVVKNLPANTGDTGFISGSGRFSGGGNGNPLQYSCLENPMDRGASWSYSPWDLKESNMTGDGAHSTEPSGKAFSQ